MSGEQIARALAALRRLTTAQKAECIALAEAMDRVKAFPGGKSFVVGLFLVAMKKAGLVLEK